MFSGYGGYSSHNNYNIRNSYNRSNRYNNYNNRPRGQQNRPQGRPARPAGMMPMQGQMPGRQAAQQGPQGQRLATPEEMGITFEPIESIFGNMNQSPGQGAQGPQPGSVPPESAPEAKNPPPAAKPVQPALPTQAKTDTDLSLHIDKIGNFVQNERNGAMFYEHLAAVCPSGELRQNLTEIAETCRKSSSLFGSLYKAAGGKDYAVKDTQVDTSVGYRKGIKWAIREEGLALREIAQMYEKSGDNTLMSALAGKMGVLGALIGFTE